MSMKTFNVPFYPTNFGFCQETDTFLNPTSFQFPVTFLRNTTLQPTGQNEMGLTNHHIITEIITRDKADIVFVTNLNQIFLAKCHIY